MTIYNVLVPRGDALAAASGTVFVPEHFSCWAFLLGPLWLARYRVWRGLIGYAAVLVLLTWAMRWLPLPQFSYAVAVLLLALFLGLEGQYLRRAALERRGFALADVVVSHNYAHAEQVFFAHWQPGSEAPAPARAAPDSVHVTYQAADVLGSFPEPGGFR